MREMFKKHIFAASVIILATLLASVAMLEAQPSSAEGTSAAFQGVITVVGTGTASIVNPPQNKDWFPNLSSVVLNSPPIRWPNLSRETRVVSMYITCSASCTIDERIRHDVSAVPSGVVAPVPMGYQSSTPLFSSLRANMTNVATTGQSFYSFSSPAGSVQIPLGVRLKAGEAFGVSVVSAGSWNVRYVFEER